jgi:hypothetical protein
MNSPYCGWNKNSNDNPTEASDYDFLQFSDEEEFDPRITESNSLNHTSEHKNYESK